MRVCCDDVPLTHVARKAVNEGIVVHFDGGWVCLWQNHEYSPCPRRGDIDIVSCVLTSTGHNLKIICNHYNFETQFFINFCNSIKQITDCLLVDTCKSPGKVMNPGARQRYGFSLLLRGEVKPRRSRK